MKFRQVWLLGLALCATGQVFAQEPASAEPAPAAPQAATPAPPPANAKTVNTQPIATPAPTPPAAEKSPIEGELDAEKIMAAQKAGYVIKNENGQTLLCRKDLQTGSRLRHKTSCLTAREWEQLQAENQMQLKSLERRPRMNNK
ncbi:hypothetical protein [Steroidobacter sp.]|uniref:hypothetical protein n=1 Tax=Steroidobacter sp. TaxID=1978227 RepID=UPI001A52ADD9|nr:hypothetical protein [Steroidobacter sp.]MBL8269682.1 hypothetical protein [Steroidobacter sp.]